MRKTTSEGFGRDGPVQTVEGMGLRGSREPRFGGNIPSVRLQDGQVRYIISEG